MVENINRQMLKNPLVDDKNKNSVQNNPHVDDTKRKILQKKSIVVVSPKKEGSKQQLRLL
jgi:hypothetical protein